MKQTEFSISELSKEFAITTRTMRHYEELGLLSPIREGQKRIYTLADRTRLRLILRGKRLGFSLEESKDIINMYDPEQNNVGQLKKLINAIRERRKQLNQQLDDLLNLLEEMNIAEKNCIKALKASEH